MSLVVVNSPGKATEATTSFFTVLCHHSTSTYITLLVVADMYDGEFFTIFELSIKRILPFLTLFGLLLHHFHNHLFTFLTELNFLWANIFLFTFHVIMSNTSSTNVK